MTTLEQALDTVSQLSTEQQEMLLDIVKHRLVEARRREIEQNAKEAIAAFHQGRLKPQPVEDIITECRIISNSEEVSKPALV
ncbi:MAG: hypothetical protein VKK04_00375 [Synechococcales bacterium]|nr:hypothetical protein [Synechococcales bacterium]